MAEKAGRGWSLMFPGLPLMPFGPGKPRSPRGPLGPGKPMLPGFPGGPGSPGSPLRPWMPVRMPGAPVGRKARSGGGIQGPPVLREMAGTLGCGGMEDAGVPGPSRP